MPGPDPTVRILRDPHGRRLDYLRLAITDRCNLRCRYCRPSGDDGHVDRDQVLSLEELRRVAAVLAAMGVRKVRITGGEPLVRRGVVDLTARLAALPETPEVLLTTNGLLLEDRLADLAAAGLRRVNLSLDSLDREIYRRIAGVDALPRVLPLLEAVPAAGLGLKINVVVLPGINDGSLADFVALTRDRDLTVRFIEPMPFDGRSSRVELDGDEILQRLSDRFTLTRAVQAQAAVAELYAVAGHRGRIGIIRGHTRTFCGVCSRLRIDARGRLRTCLYGAPALDLRPLLRAGAADPVIAAAVRGAVAARLADGHAAETSREGCAGSMVQIGG